MSTRQSQAILAVVGVLALMLLLAHLLPIPDLLIPGNLYVALHLAIELFAICVAIMVFTVTWNPTAAALPVHLTILGSGFLAVGLLDLVHTLSFPGMPDLITPASADKAISFWLIARFVSAAVLLSVALLPTTLTVPQRLKHVVLAGSLLFVIAACAVVLGSSSLPKFFIEGEGLTPLKISAEAVLSVLFAATGSLLWRHAHTHPGVVNWRLLAGATWILALSELMFASYTSMNDTFNAAGHVYKFIAYAMIFRAVFVVAVRAPYQALQNAQKQLSESDARYAGILASALDGIIVLDEQQRVVLFNTAAERIFGIAAARMIGQPLDQLLPDAARSGHRELVRGFTANGGNDRRMAANRDVQGRRADGELFPTEISISRSNQDGHTYMTAIVRDVSARVRTEHARAETQRELERVNATLRAEIAQRRDTQERLAEVMDLNEHIVKSAPLGMVAYRATGECEFANDAAAAIIGTTVERVRAENFRQSSAWRDSGLLELAERVLNLRRAESGEISFISASGRNIWIDCALAPFSSGGEDHLLVMFKDHSERKDAELALRAARDNAERASRAKSDFLARMSHELRTPLNAILGFSQILQLEPLPPMQGEHIDEIQKAGNHLLTLIDELLDLSRIEHGRINIAIAPTYLDVVLRDALTLVEPLIRQNDISVRTPLTGGLRLMVAADSTRLKQILVNLLSNAAKYNRPGGSIEIQIGESPGLVRVSVTDTGPGISAEKQKLLFTPFSRLGAEYSATEGAGIGLALSKKLAELMNAALGMHSEPGKGSTFWLELPRAESTPRIAAPPRPAANNDDGIQTVLYIEDNRANVRVVEAMLRREPRVRVIVAVDGESGLELASTHRPHLVLVDLHLPDIDGYTVHQRLRDWEEMNGIPVIAVSADAMPQDIERAKVAGFFDYVTKPIQMDELIRTVRRALDVSRAAATGSRSGNETRH